MDIKILEGKVITEIKGLEEGSDEVIFTTNEGVQYKMYHSQDCCESVSIDDVCGDISDLLNTPILKSEEVSNEDFEKSFENSFNIVNEWGSKVDEKGRYKPESHTWTFYKLATINGYVDIRWYGESNGYYSESVSFVEVGSDEDW